MTASAFYGKYRGVVTDTNDPLHTGRIKARVPDVFGDRESGWALPCAPFGGTSAGFFALPARDAGVWIEFEHGDPDHPIWSGCWWGSAAEMPPLLQSEPARKVLVKTAGGHSLLLDDTAGSGGITLQTSGGQKLVLGAAGIEIDNGNGATLKLAGTQVAIDGKQVSINQGALEVT